jgi:hypothetical protein
MFHKTVAIIPRSVGPGVRFSGLFVIHAVDLKGIAKKTSGPEQAVP